MDKQTCKVLAAVALIISGGIAVVETTRSTASANPLLVHGGAGAYASSRVDDAFAIVAAMPPVPAFETVLAAKGDKLPSGCMGPFEADVAAECIDTAYEIESGPSLVLESRFGATSILTRMDSLTVAAEY